MHIPLPDLKAEYATIKGEIAQATDEVLSLPVYTELSPEQIEPVAGMVLKYYGIS